MEIRNLKNTDLDINTLMVNFFLAYKYRKDHKALNSKDAKLPEELIKLYYSDMIERDDLKNVKRSFINRYIKNESAMENVHEKDEIKGLEVMYEDMSSMSPDEFEMFTIMSLHRDLYSKCPHPESGGKIRNIPVYLPGTGTELSDYSNIFDDLCSAEEIVNNLKKVAITMKETENYENIIDYIESCIKLKCYLIKVHPFFDGNGRTIRCFINKLFEIAGIPPVYIKANEKFEYTRAMNNAINEDNYEDITNFYLYKICDSIIELDINEKLKEDRKKIKEEQPKKIVKSK